MPKLVKSILFPARAIVNKFTPGETARITFGQMSLITRVKAPRLEVMRMLWVNAPDGSIHIEG